MWVEHSFGTDNGVQHGPEGVDAHFMSLRDGRPLSICMRGTKVSPRWLPVVVSDLPFQFLSCSHCVADVCQICSASEALIQVVACIASHGLPRDQAA